jgi:hypothetical protein
MDYNVAKYTPSLNSDYAGNPYIEALPLRMTMDKFWDEVEDQVAVPDNFAELDLETLEQKASKIMSSVSPTSLYYEVYCDVLNVLKVGYCERNPLDENTKRWQNQIATSTFVKTRATAPSIKFTGYSGLGKTTLVESILTLIDPIIKHPESGPCGVDKIQIVYIKINIPGNADIKEICLEIFGEIDKVLGTEYKGKYESKTAKLCISKLITLCTTLLIGMLIFDEIQNICMIKANAKKNLFTFFDRLTNEARIPTIKIGTSKANNLTDNEFTNARRLGVPHEWLNFKEEDEDWKALVDYAWDYQLLPDYVDLNDVFRKQIHHITQGIPHCLFFLIEQANIYALRNGVHVFNSKLLDIVFDTKFRLMKPALIALRHGNLEAFDALMNINVELGVELKKLIKQVFKIVHEHKLKGEEAVALFQQIKCYLPEYKLTKAEAKMAVILEKEEKLLASKMIINGEYREVPI